MTFFRRTVAAVAAVCVLGASLPSFAQSPAFAGLVRTDEVAQTTSTVQDRIAQLLTRDEVRAALIARGVDPAHVQARVDALTDDEANRLARGLDQLPAGGEILGILLTIFIVLLITDILGLTKVFPFTRPIR